MEHLKPKDQLIVSELSRLARSVGQISIIVDRLIDNDIYLTSIKEGIKINGRMNIQTKTIVTMFSLFSEIERDLISERTKEGLKAAKEKNIEFEQVTLMVGSAPKAIHLSLGEMKINAEFIETALAHFQTLVSPDAPVVMTFKKAYFPTGYDLEQFAKQLGIEIGHGEVEQK